MLCMWKVSKVHTGLSIESNVIHVKGIKSSLRALIVYIEYTIRALRLCMSKMSKEIQNGLTHLCL